MSDLVPVPIQQPVPWSAVPQVSDSAPPSWNGLRVEQAVHDAFMLGWLIVELRSRVKIAVYEPASSTDSSLRLASLWHANVNRIAALHSKAFSDRETANTLYEPPPKESLSYLYPTSPQPDYADIGVSGADAQGQSVLPKFGLYEVTRRAINCLALLYFSESDSLTPTILAQFQDHLADTILTTVKNQDNAGMAEPADGSLTREEKLTRAKKVLTDQTVKFLNAWHGYLRENYYVGGKIPNDSVELVAYEAGHYLSRISWDISVATIPLELEYEAAKLKGETCDLAPKFVEEWQKVFRVQAMVRLQHEITALSTALDEAYYVRTNQPGRPADDDTAVELNPDLPSRAIQAVKNSINYWQRAVKWIADNQNNLRLSQGSAYDVTYWSKPLRLALTEQASIWQTLLTGQQSLRAYNIESVTQDIMQDVMKEIQQSVRMDFTQGVKQAEQVMKEMATEVKQAIEDVGKTAVDSLDALIRPVRPYLGLVIGGIIVVAIFFVVIAVAVPQINSALVASGGAGASAVVTAILGYFGLGNLDAKKKEQQKEIENKSDGAKTAVDNKANQPATTNAGGDGLLTQIQGAARDVGTEMLKALNRGYEQIRIILDGLQRSVAVAYPLVEFVELHFKLENSAAFLTDVIWSGEDRREQMKVTLRAAFGPLATFIDSSTSNSAGDAAVQVDSIENRNP